MTPSTWRLSRSILVSALRGGPSGLSITVEKRRAPFQKIQECHCPVRVKGTRAGGLRVMEDKRLFTSFPWLACGGWKSRGAQGGEAGQSLSLIKGPKTACSLIEMALFPSETIRNHLGHCKASFANSGAILVLEYHWAILESHSSV